MEHHFNTDIAKLYGVNEAIFIHNLYFWIFKNECNGRHYYNGRNWTYNSLTAFEKLFPYFSRKQLRTIIDKCEKNGAIIRGNFNKEGYDKTSWYALADEIISLYTGYAQSGTGYAQSGTGYAQSGTGYAQSGTGYAQSGTPIPDSKPDSKPDSDPPQKKTFVKPTIEQVMNYCMERRRGVDPQKWYNHYSANGWHVGKVKMVDWKAAVRTWEKERPKEEHVLE